MPNLDEKLAKSLEEIEAKAEAVLSKSEKVEDEKEEDEEEEAEEKSTDKVEKGLKPDEVSSDEDKEADSDDKKEKADDEEEDDKEADEDEKEEDTKKSITDEFTSNDTIAKSIEVSDFLSQFTRVNGEVLDTLRADINKSLDTSTHTATILAKSFSAIMKSQEGLTDLVKSQASALKSQESLIKSLQERLEGVEKQPAVRKSVINTMEKSFDHSAGLGHADEKPELSKSEKVNMLTNMAIEGKNGVTINDVVAFESTGQIRPELNSIFNQ